MTSLKDIGEFKLIDGIKRGARSASRDIVIGIGDDCAAIKKDANTVNLISTDLLLEGIHFDLTYISPSELGMKAAAVNISDIAAMGGTPKYMLMSLAINKKISYEFVKEFYSGVKKVCKKFGVDLIGGDTSSSKDKLFLSVTIIGEAKKGSYITRQGAKAGDHIYVTGNLGNSAAGLDILQKKRSVDDNMRRYLTGKHHKVTPRVDEGKFLAASKSVSAMIDMSDGIGSDLRRICDESKVGAAIDLESIPVSIQLNKYSKSVKRDPLDYALYGGEDYELLFTVKPKHAEKLIVNYKKKFKKNIIKVGEIVKGRKLKSKNSDGILYDISYSYEHFLG